jgi:hypothetical protein
MLRSDEQPFTDFVNQADTKGDTKRERHKEEGQRIAKLIDAERSSAPTGATPEAVEEARKEKATRVNKLLEELAQHTSVLFARKTLPVCVAGAYTGRDAAGFATGMSVKPLTMNKLPKGETPTSASNVKFADLNARRESPGGASFYIKGHC